MAKGCATWEPSGKKLPYLDRMVLTSRECEAAQVDQVALIVTLQSGMRISVWLRSQAALAKQIATVSTTTSRKTKQPRARGARGRQGALEFSHGIDATSAVGRKPLEHERHPSEMLVGDERAIAFGLKR